MPWMQQLDERQVNEVRFDRLYVSNFNHGTDGHNARLIISKLADMLDVQQSLFHQLEGYFCDKEVEQPIRIIMEAMADVFDPKVRMVNDPPKT